MKTKLIFLGGLLAGLLSSPYTAQAESDLTAFKGNYRGPMNLRFPDGSVDKGRATLRLTGSANAGRAKYKATIPDDMGGSDSYPTSITLARNNKANVTDLLVGIAGTNNAKPGKGRYSTGRRTLKINATNGEGITLRGTATVRNTASRRLLNLKLVSTDPGGSYVFSNRLKSRLP